MEEKLQKILDEYDIEIGGYEESVQRINARIEFFKNHNFIEELKAERLRLDTLQMAIHKWREMYTKIEDVLNKWNS